MSMLLSDIKNFKGAILNLTLYEVSSPNDRIQAQNENSMGFFRPNLDSFYVLLDKPHYLAFPKDSRDNPSYLEVLDFFNRGITVVCQIISIIKEDQKQAVIVNLYPFYDAISEFMNLPVMVPKGLIKQTLKKIRKSNNNAIENKIADTDYDNDQSVICLPGIEFLEKVQNATLDANEVSDIFSLKISNREYFLFKRANQADFEQSGIDEIAESLNQFGKNFSNSKKLNSNESYLPDFIANALDEASNLSCTNNDKELYENDSIFEKIRALTIVCSDIMLPLTLCENSENISDAYIQANKIIVNKQSEISSYCLGEGSLSFSMERCKVLNSLIQGELQNIAVNGKSYLKQWDNYSNIEMYLNLKKAVNVGFAKIISVEPKGKHYKVFLDQKIDLKMLVGCELNISSKIPRHLLCKPDLSHYDKDFINALIGNGDLDQYVDKGICSKEHISFESRGSNETQRCMISDNSFRSGYSDYLYLESDIEDFFPKVNQYIFLSLSGNTEMFKRRKIARSKIISGQCENPMLGLLIEDSKSADEKLKEFAKNKKSKHIEPLSDRIREKIFPINPPTPTQLRAIDIALNTPDIAIIQGPPGTGKTTVITALIERITELSDKRRDMRGDILVSGFQHDAVENIIERLSINSLPPVKFGEKRGKSVDKSQSMHRVNMWAEQLSANIRKAHPEILCEDELSDFEVKCIEYELDPSDENAFKLLDYIIDGKIVVNSKIIDKAREIKRQLCPHNEESDESLRKCLNRLRTKPSSFKDDGIYNCKKLIEVLDDEKTYFECNKSDLDLLKQYSEEFESDEQLKAYLSKVQEFKDRALYDLLPRPHCEKAIPKQAVLEICSEAREYLKKAHLKGDSESSILRDFLLELECNPLLIKNSIQKYQIVYSATTQQSLGTEILKAKLNNDSIGLKSDEDPLPSYDTVVIDEAARATPTDLLIPMVQARKRVILVGDHRQLSHMVDEIVVSTMDQEDVMDTSFLKESMFGYLFSRLKRLEKVDGIQRTITLDAQYRTAPCLGNFCSDFFYKRHSQLEAYSSPRPASDFRQELKYIAGLNCMWVDLPYSDDTKVLKSNSGSSYRKREAEICVYLLSQWLNEENGKNLTFGIITFYSEQVNQIMESLVNAGIAERTDDANLSKIEIKPEFRYLNNGRERIRVGSVDSFQGMEFDVVLLSIVRTLSKDDIDKLMVKYPKEEQFDFLSRKVAGFLTMENRLCVSLSRQKKFLGIVGDKNYVNHPVMRKAVPSLYNFYKMCEDKELGVGRIFECR